MISILCYNINRWAVPGGIFNLFYHTHVRICGKVSGNIRICRTKVVRGGKNLKEDMKNVSSINEAAA